MGRTGRWMWWAAFITVAVTSLTLGCRERNPRNRDNEGDAVTVHGPDAGPPIPPVVIPQTCPPLCPPGPPATVDRQPRPSPVPAENVLPGAPSWRDGRRAGAGEVELFLS